MMKYRFSIPAFLIVLILSSQIFAQSMCPITTLTVNRIRGKVLTNDQQQVPIKQAKVELFSLGETDSLVASAFTDDLGYFNITNVQKGKYAIEAAFAVEGVTHLKYRFVLKVKKSNDTRSSALIMVKLDANCFDSEVSISKQR